jgi:hypothetical protein
MAEADTEDAYHPEHHKIQELFYQTDKYILKPKLQWKDLVLPQEVSKLLYDNVILPQRWRSPPNILLHGVRCKLEFTITKSAFWNWKKNYNSCLGRKV